MSEEGKIILEAIGDLRSELKGEIAELRTDVSELKTDVSELKTDVSELKTDVSGLKEDVSGLKEDNISLKAETASLRAAVNRLELKMENELEKNIKLVMESHLDLSRKLDEAIEIKKQFQLGLVRIDILERDVKDIKEYVDYPV